jgi:secreted trypsin-like serine protease
MRMGALTVAITLAIAAPAAASPDIVGGTAVGPGAQPSLAYVLFASHGQHFSCTGTVVAPTLVLTAAHCGEAGATTYEVVIGSPDIDDATPATIYRVASSALDPAYTGTPGTDDAALLTLTTPTHAPAMALAAPSATAASLTGAPAVIAGWGATAGGQQPITQLLDAPTVIQSPGYCSSVYSPYDPGGQLCVLNFPGDDTSTCQGDSGGPLLVTGSDGQPVDVGIVGFQSGGCDPQSADFFTAISAVSTWIAGQIQAVQDVPVTLTTASFRLALREAIGGAMVAEGSSGQRAAHRRVICSQSASQRECLVSFRARGRAYVGTMTVAAGRDATGIPETDVTYVLRDYTTDCRAAPRPPGTGRCTMRTRRGHIVISD